MTHVYGGTLGFLLLPEKGQVFTDDLLRAHTAAFWNLSDTVERVVSILYARGGGRQHASAFRSMLRPPASHASVAMADDFEDNGDKPDQKR